MGVLLIGLGLPHVLARLLSMIVWCATSFDTHRVGPGGVLDLFLSQVGNYLRSGDAWHAFVRERLLGTIAFVLGLVLVFARGPRITRICAGLLSWSTDPGSVSASEPSASC